MQETMQAHRDAPVGPTEVGWVSPAHPPLQSRSPGLAGRTTAGGAGTTSALDLQATRILSVVFREYTVVLPVCGWLNSMCYLALHGSLESEGSGYATGSDSLLKVRLLLSLP